MHSLKQRGGDNVRAQGRILPPAPKSGKCSGIFTDLVPQPTLRHKSTPARSVRISRESRTSCAPCVGEKFYPSGCGGHKNSEKAATFSEFLGGRKNFSPALIPERYYKASPGIGKQITDVSRVTIIPTGSRILAGKVTNRG